MKPERRFKLAKKVYGYTAGNTTRYDYSGNFLYENSAALQTLTTTYAYDHQGNNRVVFAGHTDGKE